ncbi:MAG TPA: hypothetical protein VFT64_07265 [Rickettsiales bacterium]|nr:hypothetical protein [Rickettsiales bacterium]
MQEYQPEELNDLIVKVDVFGITGLSKYEHYRQDRIKRLTGIGVTEKEILLKHMVFIGATAEMVEYALGMPKLVFKDSVSNPAHRLYYVYFLVGDKRPTVFEFSCIAKNTQACELTDNKTIFALSRAYKKSTIDFNTDGSDNQMPQTAPAAAQTR